MCCCINNLVQAQDNNANGIHANAYLLWDFNDLCETKHDKSQLMRHKGLHMEWSHFLELAILKDNYTNDLDE